MFNVSSLLLDDALKPATPLIAPLVSGVAGLSAECVVQQRGGYIEHLM